MTEPQRDISSREPQVALSELTSLILGARGRVRWLEQRPQLLHPFEELIGLPFLAYGLVLSRRGIRDVACDCSACIRVGDTGCHRVLQPFSRSRIRHWAGSRSVTRRARSPPRRQANTSARLRGHPNGAARGDFQPRPADRADHHHARTDPPRELGFGHPTQTRQQVRDEHPAVDIHAPDAAQPLGLPAGAARNSSVIGRSSARPDNGRPGVGTATGRTGVGKTGVIASVHFPCRHAVTAHLQRRIRCYRVL